MFNGTWREATMDRVNLDIVDSFIDEEGLVSALARYILLGLILLLILLLDLLITFIKKDLKVD